MRFKRHNQAITIWRARLSFPQLFEPKPIMSNGRQIGDPRFSAIIVVPPDFCVKIQQIEDWLITQSWPEGVPPGVQIKRALIPGDVHRPNDANLAGKMVLSANAKADSPPQIVSIHRDAAGHFPVLTDRHHVYSGCEANVSVGLYTTQLKTTEPQINCGLNSVQPTERPMDRFDNRQNADAAFGQDPYADEYAQGPENRWGQPAPGGPENQWGQPAPGAPAENQWGQPAPDGQQQPPPYAWMNPDNQGK